MRRAGVSSVTRYAIALAPPDICKLVLADRSRITRRFVLLGPWTPSPSFGAMANFGALPRGYDHGCRPEGDAKASACMLAEHFRRRCPNATLEHVRELLDDPHLIAWYVHHDAILFRDLSVADALVSHPKVAEAAVVASPSLSMTVR